jgi:hypothetical protein
MNKPAFHHVRIYTPSGNLFPRGGVTIAMSQIPGWYFKTLAVGTFFEESIGKAVCSIEDNYCKKVGRELAQSRMKATRLDVLDCAVFPDGTKSVILEDFRDKSVYSFVQYTDSDRVYLLGYNTAK